MRKVRLVLIPALALLMQFLPGISLQVANAAAVTATGTNASVCNQEVGSTTNVTAVRLAGGDCVVQFKNVGTTTWTVPTGLNSAWVLIIAGGGGGGGDEGGGGGAGGYRENETYSLSGLSTVTVTVGDGGAGGTDNSAAGENGENSAFHTLVATGGGGGGTAANTDVASYTTIRQGKNGGSGGGAAGETLSNLGGTATPSGQGFDGGDTGAVNGGAGGGGAGGVGANSRNSSPYAGAGGAGKSSSITGSAVTRASGGGGGTGNTANDNSTTQTSGGGGLGGGRDGVGSAGQANTGGGGGGGGAPSGGNLSGYAGGSGIVIVRYTPDTTAPTITGPSSATGATSSISIAENSTAVHTFTADETVTWSKSGTDSSFFSISSGGVLTITARNFEAPADVGSDNTYVVVITATDSASNATNQTLTVTITNVNEAPTISTNSSAATHSITQAENISSVATYTATDVDAGASLSWSLSGTDAADFAIVSGTGVLTFASNPDYEAPADSDTNNIYIFIVTVSDGSLTDTQTVTITITNANESASIAAPTVSGAIYKGITTTITVTSSVAGKVRFFAGGKRISTCLSRTTTGSYPNYSATCSWKPAVQSKQLLTATITPTDNTFSAATSAATEVRVGRRGTVR